MLSSPISSGPSRYTCALSRVRAPMQTSAPTMQYGPISADSATLAWGSTIAVGWMATGFRSNEQDLFAVRQLAKHLRLRHQDSVYARRAGHLRHGRFALRYFHFDAELIAWTHR